MEERRLPKEVMKWRPTGRRKLGRPKLTWAEGIRELMGEKGLTLRRLMSYIYGAPILDVSRSHTTTQHSR